MARPPADGGGRPPRPTLGRRALALADALWRPALVLAAFFAIWWFVAAREYVPNYLVPTPGQVWTTMTDQWSELARHTLVTLYETVIGFVLAAALGLATASPSPTHAPWTRRSTRSSCSHRSSRRSPSPRCWWSGSVSASPRRSSWPCSSRSSRWSSPAWPGCAPPTRNYSTSPPRWAPARGGRSARSASRTRCPT
ncbi:hypothetical protein GCM10027614_06020 [Micromonospora vulcania]